MPQPQTLDIQSLTDEELRRWIVEARTSWQAAYETLIHERYGGLVMGAKASVEKRYQITLPTVDVFGELYLHFCGRGQEWKNLKSWDSSRSLSTWLWVVVKNLCGRMARKERDYEGMIIPNSIQDHEDEGEHTTPDKPDSSPPVDEVVGLQKLIQQIGEECAQILRLKYYHDMTDTDIGRYLDISREWANRQRQKCLARLADLFREQGLGRSDFSVFDTA